MHASLEEIRSLIAEKSLALLPLVCSFIGCQEDNLKESNIEEHEKICQYRLVECVIPNCEIKVPFNKLLDHIYKSNIHGDEDHPRINSRFDTAIKIKINFKFDIRDYGLRHPIDLRACTNHVDK